MLYKIFLYSSPAAAGSAPALGMVNAAICSNSEKQWKDNDAAVFMNSFDANAVVRQIKNELTDPVTKKCKCHPIVKFPPEGFDKK